MTNLSIVTDASSDLPRDLVEEYNIHMTPIRVVFGEEKVYEFYSDWGSITKEEFYQKLRTCENLPSTAIPPPKAYFEAFEEASKNNKEILAIFASSKLTGIFQSAKRVAQQLEDKDITIIDSQVAGPALGLLVLEAAKMAQNGASKDEIVTKINQLISQVAHTSVMDTLENVYRSGRVSFVKKFMGEAFKIKPVIHFKDGETSSGGTLRGSDQVLERLKFLGKKAVNRAITDHVFIWHTQNFDKAQEIKQQMEEANNNGKEIRILEAGPIIGTHLGEKMLGVIYLGKYNKRWLHKMKD